MVSAQWAPEKQREAVRRSAELRQRRAALKRSIAHGTLPVAEMVDSPALATVPLFEVLQWQHHWGEERARRLLHSMGRWAPSESRACGELTERQREKLREVLR